MSAENPPQSQDGILEAQNLKVESQARLDAALERHENLDETLRNDEVKLLSGLLTHFEDQTKAAEVRNRLKEHAEAMHIIAQEENGIEKPTSLKEHLDSLEPAKSENDPSHKESVENVLEKGKEGEPDKDHEKKDKHDKHEAHEKHDKHDNHKHGHAHHEAKPITKKEQRIANAVLFGGLFVAGGLGEYLLAPAIVGWLGLTPAVSGALAVAGAGAGWFGIFSVVTLSFGYNFIKSVWDEGKKEIGKMSLGGLSLGSGGGGKKAKGGGGHAPAAGGHGGGH